MPVVTGGVDAIFRSSAGLITARLASRYRDLGLAEDALSAAFSAALKAWSESGIPGVPEAWLYQTAKRHILDTFRRRATAEDYTRSIISDEAAEDASFEAEFPDERLKLLFVCAHPSIASDLHVPLMLNTVMRIEARRLAGAFVVPASTMSQRLTRAKSKIRDARIPFLIPEPRDLPQRLHSVLTAIYAGYGIGWDEAKIRVGTEDLSQECLSLARMTARLSGGAPEALGLLSMLLFSEARRGSRCQDGNYVPLAEQDTSLWVRDHMTEAAALLNMAFASKCIGPFQLMGAIQNAHIEARLSGNDYASAILPLYETLRHLAPSLGVETAYAIALANATAPEHGLGVLDAIEPARSRPYQPYWAARAELLARMARDTEAADAFQIALGLTTDPTVRAYLARKQSSVQIRTI